MSSPSGPAQDDTVVLQLDPSESNGRNSEGTFISLNDGTLVFAYARYITGGNGDHDPSVIAARYSEDDGRTWSSDERILVEPHDAMNVMSPSLLRMQDGNIVLCYARKEMSAQGNITCVPWVRFSDDEMSSWSEPVPLTFSNGYYVVNNDRILQTKSGRLVVPVAHHRFASPTLRSYRRGSATFTDPGLILCFLSDDNGRSWYESTNSYYRCFPDGRGLQEPGVIELNDGQLWSWTRTGWAGDEKCGRQWQSFSADGGQIWTEPTPSEFISPYSPLSMKRIPTTGHLLAVWNDHSGIFPTPSYDIERECNEWERHRTPLSCAISTDEGITWRHHYLLEDSPVHGFCYTAIHFTEDAVLLAYCAGGQDTGTVLDRIRMRRLPLTEIY